MSYGGGGYDDYSDDEYGGEADHGQINHPDDFKSRHGCPTDIPCCVLFVASMFALAGVAIYGFVNGDTRKLHHGIDHNGNICGVSESVKDAPKLFFCGPAGIADFSTEGSLTGQIMGNAVCVQGCPHLFENVYQPQTTIPACGLAGASTAPYPTKDTFNICVPDEIHKQAGNAVTEGMSHWQDRVMRVFDSAQKAWWVYILVFFMAIFLGYAYMFFLKACARLMVWVVIVVIFLLSLGLGIWCIAESNNIGSNAMLESFGQWATTLTVLAGVCFLAAAFGTLCLICCCGHQIEDAIAAVEMSCDVMVAMPTLFCGPIIQAILKIIVFVVLLFGFIHLAATADVTAGVAGQMREFDWSTEEKWMMVFYAFMFFWISCYVAAAYQFAMSYATADYYFSEILGGGDDERDYSSTAVFEGYCVGNYYHCGSLAFGSFIIAVFAMIQRMLEYIDRQNEGNALVRCIVCILYTITICFKQCASFINKNAYISMALTGNGFCSSACKAVAVMGQKAGAIFILAQASYVFQLLGIALITVLCGLFSHALVQFETFTDAASDSFLPNPIVVVIICCVIGAGLAKIFMDVLDMVSATLVFCFAIDGNPNKVPESVKFAYDTVSKNNAGSGDYSY